MAKTVKVKTKIKIYTGNYYKPTKYIMRTVEAELPVVNGVYQTSKLSDNIVDAVADVVIPSLKERVLGRTIVWWKMPQEYYE